MFTGIVEDVGVVRHLLKQGSGAVLTVSSGLMLSDIKLGDSIAVDGVCLTVMSFSSGDFTLSLSAETLARSTLGSLRSGAHVNLERALKLGDRLGGHFVYGHVDGVGRIVSIHPDGHGGHGVFTFSFPQNLRPYLVAKGSVAIDGISLTLASLGVSSFSVAVVPHTSAHTTLGHKGTGSSCNLEVDVIARYLVGLHRGASSDSSAPLEDSLRRMTDAFNH